MAFVFLFQFEPWSSGMGWGDTGDGCWGHSTDCNVNTSSNVLRIAEFIFNSHFTWRVESEGGGWKLKESPRRGYQFLEFEDQLIHFLCQFDSKVQNFTNYHSKLGHRTCSVQKLRTSQVSRLRTPCPRHFQRLEKYNGGFHRRLSRERLFTCFSAHTTASNEAAAVGHFYLINNIFRFLNHAALR